MRFSEGDWGYITLTGSILERGITEEPRDYDYEDELSYDMDEDVESKEDEDR